MNEYLEIIKTSFIFFPVIAFIFTIPYILNQYHKYGSIYYLRVIIIYSFILYLLTAYFLVILPLPTVEIVSKLTASTTQLIPFKFIHDFINQTSLNIINIHTYIKALLEPCCYVVLYNILLCLPFGAYLHYYFKKNLKETILYTFLLSLFFELTQLTGLYFIYPRGYRLFDVDDLILNTFGGMLGYYIGILFIKVLPDRDKLDAKSYQLGHKVSFLKKLVAFNIDIFILTIVIYILSIFTTNHYLYYLCIIIYYILIPLITNGKTLSYKFLNLKIESIDGITKRYQIFLRQVLWLTEVLLPIILIKLLIYLIPSLSIYIRLIITLISFIYYLIILIKIFIKKQLIYEVLSKTNIISTINEKIDNNIKK